MSKRLDLYLSALLVLLTALVYWPVLHHDFINYDDHLYVTDNPVVQDGVTWEGVRWAFTSWHASNWHPITWISHMIDGSLFYLYSGGHHLTNLLFHLANTLLLFHLLRRLGGGRWRCVLVAALFAWHPLHVESVAWVAERKDVLSGLFLFLTIWAYVRYAERPKASRYLLALLWFALGLMSKPMLVTLPFLLLLLDYWPLRRATLAGSLASASDSPLRSNEISPTVRSLASLSLEKVPFFALSLVSSIITVCAQRRSGALKPLEAVPFLYRVGNALVSYGAYLWKLMCPVDLAVFYPLPPAFSPVLLGTTVLLLAAITVWAWHCRRCHPWLGVGWLWYLGAMVPVIGLVQVGGQSMADRYTYIPFIGLFIMFAWGVAEWVPRRSAFQHASTVLIVMALLGCLVGTRSYVGCWQNSRTLFEHALKVTRNNFLAEHNLAVALKNEGDLAGAVYHYRQSLRINPDFATAHYNLAMNLAAQGEITPALFHFSEVARLKMDDPEKHNAFGIALADQGHLDEAVGHFTEAVRRDPHYSKAQYNLAFALSRQGKIPEAIAGYRVALAMQPRWPEALQSLAWLLATHDSNQLRDGAEAVRLAEEACRLTGRLHPGYLDTLAAAYAEANRLPEAIATAEKALELAKNAKQNELAQGIRTRLQMYQAGKPFRQTI